MGMTHIFDDTGKMVPVTVIQAGPCYVTQVKSAEGSDKYNAVQVGFGDVPKKRVTRPMVGHFNKAGTPASRHLREFRVDSVGDVSVGQMYGVDIFEVGESVIVAGTSKGRGFAGAMKRHHFHGQTMTHGFMTHRRPCSVGATGPARVFKGNRGPGHMGAERVTEKGLRVVAVDSDNNLVLVSGSVPGANGGLVEVVKAGKR